MNAWARHTSGEVTDLGYQSVESASSHFYLNNKPSVAALWTDIAPQFTPAQDALMLGGEVSMWYKTPCSLLPTAKRYELTDCLVMVGLHQVGQLLLH